MQTTMMTAYFNTSVDNQAAAKAAARRAARAAFLATGELWF